MKTNLNGIFPEVQQGLPEFDHKTGNWLPVSVIAELYEVTEQTIRDWISDEIISKPVNRVLNIVEVVRSVYRHQRTLIEGIQSSALTEERIRLKKVQAELAELDLRKKREELLDADEVKKTAFAAGRRMRDALENIPNRISSILAAENDPHKCNQLLAEEIKQALTDFESFGG